VLRPQPRGIEGSTGPLAHITLHDFAKDIAKVIEDNQSGPAIVVGHAYGNVVARTLATDRPDLVRGVVLAAAVAGRVPKGEQGPTISPQIRVAIDKSHDLGLPDSERLEYMRIAFFAPGHDPSVWLGGWYPHVIDAQWAARNATSTETFFAAGAAPILDLQAEYDTVAPRRYAHVLKEALGERVTVHVVKDAGHALAPEQPKAMSDAIAAFARSIP
jgi:pimeloyl-ACP methyl ester carboxylesterase